MGVCPGRSSFPAKVHIQSGEDHAFRGITQSHPSIHESKICICVKTGCVSRRMQPRLHPVIIHRYLTIYRNTRDELPMYS